MFGGENKRVSIRFENSLLDTVLDKFGVGFGAEYRPDGEEHFVVTTDVTVSDQFYAWVCGFGKKAKIIAPAQVAADYNAHLSAILSQY